MAEIRPGGRSGNDGWEGITRDSERLSVRSCRTTRTVFAELPGLEGCFVCLRVSSGGMTKEEHEAELPDVQFGWGSPANSPQLLQGPGLSYAPAIVSLLAQGESPGVGARFRCGGRLALVRVVSRLVQRVVGQSSKLLTALGRRGLRRFPLPTSIL